MVGISFYLGKNFGVFGDGGMVVINNDDIVECILMLCNYGFWKKYFNEMVGYNMCLDEL